MTFTALPMVAGVTLPRPNGDSETDSPARSGVVLANGAARAYSNGVRRSYELSWSRMTEGDLVALRAAVRPAFVPYRHIDGTTSMCETAEVSASAVPGTDPPRFAVSTTFTEQRPRR